MIVSLTGFMGCGKSSVGRRLSQLLCCPFMDLDEVIEESAGRSIPEIFATDGEAAFRRMELETLKEILSTSELRQCVPIENPDCHPERSEGSINLVLALGGGTVMTPECAEIVHSQTRCIYLRASIETLISHLENEAAGRPMLNTDAVNCHFDQAKRVEKSALRERITSLMAERSETYEKTAHIIIDTDGKSIEAIASEILSLI